MGKQVTPSGEPKDVTYDAMLLSAIVMFNVGIVVHARLESMWLVGICLLGAVAAIAALFKLGKFTLTQKAVGTALAIPAGFALGFVVLAVMRAVGSL